VVAYGYGDEFSFVLTPSLHEQRLASQVSCGVVSLYTAAFLLHWKLVFDTLKCQCVPCFSAQVFSFPSAQVHMLPSECYTCFVR
jgi:tRNA(His) 5'-end guanylyltransferase